MTKNFDFVLVYKDYHTFKRISAVPMEFLDTIKSWLNATKILYSEGPMCLNWPNILTHIRDDFEGFVQDGGWSFLRDGNTEGENTGGGNEDSDLQSDSDYNASEEEETGAAGGAEGEASDSDFSGEDDDEDEEDGESSDVKSDKSDDSEEEGLDWDELDRRAVEQER